MMTGDLHVNTRVLISSPSAGSCVGRIEDIRAVADLVDLPGPMEAPAKILREGGVTRAAMISYYTGPDAQYIFAALEIGGKWFDYEQNEITLEVIGQYEWPRRTQ